MFSIGYLLLGILLLLCLGAVIAFSYFVIKPVQTRWAVLRARKIVASGHIANDWHFRNIYRILATAHNDLEAVKLWHRLDELKESPGQHHNNHEFLQLVGIIPPGGKLKRSRP
jgi:quinol-cytochrome oxidoreductase complex cytochrome b subunit